MAFAKAPTNCFVWLFWTKNYGIKKSSFQKSEICNFLPNSTFLPELQSAWNQTQVYGVTSNHLDQ